MQELVSNSPHIVVMTKVVMGLVVALLLSLLVNGLFIRGLRKTMRLVPAVCLRRPLGLMWLLLVPGIGAIVAWVLLPFGLPQSILAALRDRGSESWKRARSLARTGLTCCGSGLLALFALLWIVWLSHQDFQAHTIGYQGIAALATLIALVAVKLLSFGYYWYLMIVLRLDLAPSQ